MFICVGSDPHLMWDKVNLGEEVSDFLKKQTY